MLVENMKIVGIELEAIKTEDEDIEAFRSLAYDFATRELKESVRNNDRFPLGDLFENVIQKAGEAGFFSINLPEAHSGLGMDTSVIAVMLEKLSEVDASLAAIMFTNAAALQIIQEASKEVDCSSHYQGLFDQHTKPLAFPSYSNPVEVELPVVDVVTGCISGRVEFVANAYISNFVVLPASRPDESGFTYYLIDLNHDGVTKSEPILSLGLRSCPSVDLDLRNVPVTKIGPAESGERYFNAVESKLSLPSAAMSLGLMRGAFDEAFEYSKVRIQGARPIVEWPALRMMLAKIAIEVKVGETCLQTASLQLREGTMDWEQTTLATAIHLGELATRATIDGIQVLGGNGYTKDYGQEKRMRDAKQVQCLLGMQPLKKMKFIDKIVEVDKR